MPHVARHTDYKAAEIGTAFATADASYRHADPPTTRRARTAQDRMSA